MSNTNRLKKTEMSRRCGATKGLLSMPKSLKRGLYVALLLVSSSLIFGFPETLFTGSTVEASDQVESKATYHYRMKGKVRLLLFWVGKDDVGGGSISVSDNADLSGNSTTERIEVIFGSKPERVPGKRNRWGYGVEEARWEISPQQTTPVLKQTVFQGFMKPSEEETLSQVKASGTREKSGDGFLYAGSRSIVLPDEATYEKHLFSVSQDFDYRDFSPIQSAYEERLKQSPADKRNQLVNENQVYQTPYGFLTAVRQMMRTLVSEFHDGTAKWTKQRPSLVYVFNARTYRLSIKDIDYHRTFHLSIKNPEREDEEKVSVPDIAEVDFRLERMDTGDKHDFSVWFPLQGPFQGVPLRIEDRPRWWLRIELNLIFDEDIRGWITGKRVS